MRNILVRHFALGENLAFFPILTNLEYRRLSPNSQESLQASGNSSLTQMDQLINFDVFKILSIKNQHLPPDSLIRKYPEPLPKEMIRWLDYTGQSHLVQDLPQLLEINFQISYAERNETEVDPRETLKKLKCQPNKELVQKISYPVIKKVSETMVTSIEQLKLRCEANYYVRHQDFVADFQTLINWHQLYRSTSSISLIWISAIIQLFNKIAGETFKQKFSFRRNDDVARLMKYETVYKISCNNYPIVPTNFRQYQYIEKYVPTPNQRSDIILDKMRSLKQPVECPPDCSCLSSKEKPYCSFSLIQGTWESECKNRANRIECAHSNVEEMERCRNSEIKRRKGKSCRTDPNQEGEFDIEECLIWGIDYYTRKNIIYSLPDHDVIDLRLVDNAEAKSDFVNNLIKAANYNTVEGYNMRKACQYILKSQPQKEQSTNEQKSLVWRYHQPETKGDSMFSQKDRFYALHLLNVLDLKIDETGFRIHTKGKGARCLNKTGIKQSQFIVEYFGEVYELWRWYQRQDHTKRIMREQKLSNLPDFYNIYLEKHSDQKEGYDMLVVDPISHGNFASRFSHSCYPNCGTITTVSDGKYYIGMYALRDIEIGQELTFDYCSITESNLEHIQAICLCGAKICRGHYLQLGNAKQMNYVLDEYNCFLGRNSVLLHSCTENFTEENQQLLAKYNVKGNLLDGCGEWLKKWSYLIMSFIEFQAAEFKKAELAKLQGVTFINTQNLTKEEIEHRNELFVQVKKGDLWNARYQNLITSIDKLKYYLGSIKDFSPPIDMQSPQTILKALWNTNRPTNKKESQSVIFTLITHLKKSDMKREYLMIQEIDKYVQSEPSPKKKLYFVRLGFLLLSQLIRLSATKKDQLADILFFYAFTHTYFTTHQYDSLDSQKMIISFKDFLTEPSKLQNQHETCKRQYSSQFVWGQLVAWFKQTIASPQSSLSQDRRGTLSYPTIDSIVRTNTYPFDGHTRVNFFKSLIDKPFASWPPDECPWSYKNNSKSYGTFLFESHFNSIKLKGLQILGLPDELPGKEGKKLIRSVLHVIDKPIEDKFNLFAQVQWLLEGIEPSQVMNHKQLFWGEGYEESKANVYPPTHSQVQQNKTLMKRQKI